MCIQISQRNRPERLVEKEPLGNLESSEELHADFCHFDGNRYISITDRFSGFLWKENLKEIEETTTTNKLVKLIQQISFQMGMPWRLIADGAPEFHLRNSMLTPGLARLGIKHTLTSEYKLS